ncbi:MAG: STT3 domain-containing protein [Candidatus Nanohaloarchaea archaeon]|nr:STT3 domain-containing protein [Candidatus Nanohaloarchaea archaeon]
MALRDRLQWLQDAEPGDIRASGKYPGLLSLVFVFALWIRLIPQSGMQYLQALDPYMIARMSKAVATGGGMPMIDVWRYFPYGTPTYLLNNGDIFIPAYLYQLVAPFMDFLTWAQVYPALAGALMVVAMYFAGKELFDRQTGILAAFFLAAAPGVLHRSSAGWFEKEPFAAFLMISSIYLLTRAWRHTSWPAGMLSGAALGLALTVWGGAKFLVLLYPLVLVPAALLERDRERLIAAFTPTLLIGHIAAAAINPGGWSIPNGAFVLSFGLLALIWIRYLVESYDVVTEDRLDYVVPGLYAGGGLLLFLSPLYSQKLAGYVMGFVGRATQSGGGVIAGTVAENQAARAGQIIGQLGAFRAQQVLPGAIAPLSELFSGWTFSLIGTGVLLAVVGGMFIARFIDREEVSLTVAYGGVAAASAALFLTVGTLLSQRSLFWLLSAVPPAVAGAAALYFGAEDRDRLVYGGLYIVSIAYALLLLAVGMPRAVTAFLYVGAVSLVGAGLLVLAPERNVPIKQRWYLLIPVLWIVSTLYGAAQKSRLLFLTAQPVALMAGYGLSVGLHQLRQSTVWQQLADADVEFEASRAYRAVLGILLVAVVLFNGAAAYSMAQGIGGSPNQLWMENLEFMREETPADSVVLSWWDYGYWFETIGARAAIADGGNMGFYAQPGEGKINLPLADFLTAEDHTKHMDWLQSLSVDYVVLDSSMIGKYSAVSQIHNRNNNEFSSMQTASCRSRNNRCLTTSANNQTYLMYQTRGTRFLVPFRQTADGLEISGTPLMQTRRGTAVIGSVCSEDGVRKVDVPENRSAVPGCVSFHPYRQHQTLVYIPQDVMGSTLVNLYVMDAHGMPRFTEVFDNGFVKMWRVDYSQNQ